MTADWKRQALGSLLLGLATWTRPEGGLAVASVLAVLGAAAHFARRGRAKWLAWFLPAGVVAGVWMVFISLHGTGGQMQQALEAFVGAFGTRRTPPRSLLLDPALHGSSGDRAPRVGIAAACLRGAADSSACERLRPRSNPDAFLVGVALLVVATGVTLQFYLADFLGQLMDYLGNSANRMYMPAALLFGRSGQGHAAPCRQGGPDANSIQATSTGRGPGGPCSNWRSHPCGCGHGQVDLAGPKARPALGEHNNGAHKATGCQRLLEERFHAGTG